MKKKILSLTLSFTMIASLANVVMAAGENNTIVYSPLEMKYPTADITPEFVESNFSDSGSYVLRSNPTGNASTGEKIPVDSDRVFKVGDREFLLLDKDAEGNYFIVHKTPLNFSSWLYSGMSNTAGNYTHQPESTAANGWKFDCTADGNSTSLRSIAHYMNDFNTAFKPYIPQTIKDYLIVTDWKTGADSARDYTGENSEWSQTKRENNPAYTTRGKLGLLSAREYIEYFDILGYTHAGNLGIALRTPASRVYTSNGESEYSCGPMVVLATNNNVMITYGSSATTTGVIIQACFWVNNQFFKEVELESAGADVTAELLEIMTIEDLVGIYGEDGLLKLGINFDDLPTVDNVKLSGTPSVGTKLDCLYEYSSSLGLAEGETKFLWYLSVDKNSQGELIDTTSTSSITIQGAWVGKYLKAYVVPKDSQGQEGVIARGCEPLLILPEGDFAVKDSGFNNNRAWVKVSNLSGTESGVKVFLVAYNESGNVISISMMVEGSETDVFECNEISEASEYRILVLTEDGNQPLKKILK